MALKITDAQIEAWLDSRGYAKCNRPAKCKREVARIFAVALRDYGWINSITSGGTAGIYISGAANSKTEQKWRDWGVTGTGEDLLFGLFKADNMYVIKPPLNYCKDGTVSHYYCHASKSEYPASMLK